MSAISAMCKMIGMSAIREIRANGPICAFCAIYGIRRILAHRYNSMQFDAIR